jgi:predicted DNA repair protein MutK
MPSGLVALLDDVAGIAKLAAASIDDIGAAAGKAGSKAVGVVIDDTAVTPRYVVGLSPARELPIIAKIAKGSLRNKLLILLPACLAISGFLPWALTPLLMIGGAYLCFEGAEKVIEAVAGHEHAAAEDVATTDPVALENDKVAGAVRTDFILSAEIMVIALREVAGSPLLSQAVTLALVAVAITVGVYGLVAAIVKADDVGLHLSKRRGAGVRAFGRGLVKAMPPLLAALSVIGTAAMIWVGGQIVIHGLAEFGLAGPEHLLHDWGEAAAHAVPAVGGLLAWVVGAAGAGVFGLVLGGVIAWALHLIPRKGH